MTEQNPQEGGTYERQPDGSLKRITITLVGAEIDPAKIVDALIDAEKVPAEPAKKKPAAQE